MTASERPAVAKANRPATRWRKSSYSANNGECVEIAVTTDGCTARDSKDPHGGVLGFTPRRWADFLAIMKTGRFDG